MGIGRKKERDALYQLTDLSILFHKRSIEKHNGKDTLHWTNHIDSPSRRYRTGIAFEQVCLLHIKHWAFKMKSGSKLIDS